MSGTAAGYSKRRATLKRRGAELARGTGQNIVNPSPAAFVSVHWTVTDHEYVEWQTDVSEYLNGHTVWAHRLDHTPECVSPELAFIEVRLARIDDWPKGKQRGAGA